MKGLSQQYRAASEATSNIRDQDVTFGEVLFSRRHALITSHCLERPCVFPFLLCNGEVNNPFCIFALQFIEVFHINGTFPVYNLGETL